MWPSRQRPGSAHHGSRLWWLTLAMLVPGVALAAFGIRSVTRERAAAVQELREDLGEKARRAVDTLDDELERWAALTARVGSLDQAAARTVVEQMDAGAAPSAARPVVMSLDARGTAHLVSGSLLFRPSSGQPAVNGPLPVDLAAAERLELVDENFAAAVQAYESLRSSAPAAFEPWLQHRLAWSYAKDGQSDRALTEFESLIGRTGDMAGALPAPLVGMVGRCETLADLERLDDLHDCGLTLYRHLLDGQWPLERPRAEYYLEQARAWAGTDDGDVAALADLEEARRELARDVSDAVDALSASSARSSEGRRAIETDGRVRLLFWHAAEDGDATVVTMLPASFLEAAVWPRVVGDAGGRTVVRLEAPDGTAVAPATPEASGADVSMVETFRDAAGVWTVRAEAPSAVAMGAMEFAWLAILVVLVAAILIGSVSAARMVRREMEVARLKSEFVAAVSHEFRTPLTSIRQLAELLDRGIPTEERSREYYRVILGESERLSTLVEHVLDFARMEEGRKAYAFESIDTTAWLDTVVRDAETAASAAGMAIDASIPAGLPPVLGDEQALSSVLHNLIDNAIKYSPGRDRVWVSAVVDGRTVALTVRDEGVGIDADERAQLFDRFFRGRRATSATRGTGLGLSLVKHIVDAHGGNVDVSSAPGDGTAFTVRLPLAPPILSEPAGERSALGAEGQRA